MPRRILEGEVVSNKMEKTVTVSVVRRFMHPIYKKFVKKTRKFAAHDESNAIETGVRVQIEECAPISKRKTWRVISVAGEAVKQSAPANTDKKKPAPQKAEAKKAEPKKETEKKDAEKKAPAKKAAKKTTAKKAAPKKTASKKKDDKK